MKNFFRILFIIIFLLDFNLILNAAEKVEYLKTDWSFKGLFGKFDRGHFKEDIKFIRKYAHLVIQ